MPDTESKIAELISQPKSYENDGEKITNFTPQELAAADAFIAGKKAAKNPFRALKMARMSTQGPEK